MAMYNLSDNREKERERGREMEKEKERNGEREKACWLCILPRCLYMERSVSHQGCKGR